MSEYDKTAGAWFLLGWIGGRKKKDAAEALGVSQQRLSNWLSGRRVPLLKEAFQIQDVTGGSVPARSWTEKPA